MRSFKPTGPREQCPYCKGWFQVGEAADSLERPPALAHSQPACREYIEMSYQEYLASVRQRTQN